ncbi:MAG: hypothetical protein RLZZ281_1073 [Pseudomonadota bacterium]
MARPKKTKSLPLGPLTVCEPPPIEEREARLFKNGANQAIRIPKEFELPGESVMLRKEGGVLIVRPVSRQPLADLLDSWTPLEEDFPDIADLPDRPVPL